MGKIPFVVAVALMGQQLWWCGTARAEDYPDCRIRCEMEYADCSNQPQAPEAEVQAARMASCDQKLASCYAQCENLKPVVPPEGTEDNPNIIRR